MPLFRRPSCVRRCASYSQTVNSTGDAPVCGAYVRLKLGTGDQFRPSRENSRTKLQDVVTDSRDQRFNQPFVFLITRSANNFDAMAKMIAISTKGDTNEWPTASVILHFFHKDVYPIADGAIATKRRLFKHNFHRMLTGDFSESTLTRPVRTQDDEINV